MKVEQKFWTAQDGWKMVSSEKLPADPQCVLVFGGRSLVGEPKSICRDQGNVSAVSAIALLYGRRNYGHTGKRRFFGAFRNLV